MCSCVRMCACLYAHIYAEEGILLGRRNTKNMFLQVNVNNHAKLIIASERGFDGRTRDTNRKRPSDKSVETK